ncbi:hypothetical protein RF11_07994 [Thelohanellus kitauei]|uniref:Uncharacterized protein n=1 Tax=Thelohanellus kitauei TaxID=669202 RepID=A0A0C2IV14_THEKT|nr:hypothetical protein RF11_07994 [Thelohanellus kitauei]
MRRGCFRKIRTFRVLDVSTLTLKLFTGARNSYFLTYGILARRCRHLKHALYVVFISVLEPMKYQSLTSQKAGQKEPGEGPEIKSRFAEYLPDVAQVINASLFGSKMCSQMPYRILDLGGHRRKEGTLSTSFYVKEATRAMKYR